MANLLPAQVFNDIGADTIAALHTGLDPLVDSPLQADNPLEILSVLLQQVTKGYATAFPNGADGYTASLNKFNLRVVNRR